MTSVMLTRVVQSLLMLIMTLGVLGCFVLLGRLVKELERLRYEMVKHRPVMSDEDVAEAVMGQYQPNENPDP